MKILVSFFFTFFSTIALAQTHIPSAERELARLGHNSIVQKTQEMRMAAQDTFTLILDQIIGTEEAYNFPFERVQNLSKLHAPDKSFRIYTWSVPQSDGSFAFFGRLVLNDKNGLRVIRLIDGGADKEWAEYLLIKPENWYGAIYYDIIETKYKRKTYYSLLGYRPNTKTYNQKIVEVLASDNMNKLRFGAHIFNTPVVNGIKYKKRPYRLIFRYNPKAVATVRYVNKEIVMDHLAVPDYSMTEKWNMYGPDFSYHALYWKKGKWELKDEIIVNNDVKPTPQKPTQKGLPKK